MLLPGADAAEAARRRRAPARAPRAPRPSAASAVTMSFGVARVAERRAVRLRRPLREADAALYRAKARRARPRLRRARRGAPRPPSGWRRERRGGPRDRSGGGGHLADRPRRPRAAAGDDRPRAHGAPRGVRAAGARAGWPAWPSSPLSRRGAAVVALGVRGRRPGPRHAHRSELIYAIFWTDGAGVGGRDGGGDRRPASPMLMWAGRSRWRPVSDAHAARLLGRVAVTTALLIAATPRRRPGAGATRLTWSPSRSR